MLAYGWPNTDSAYNDPEWISVRYINQREKLRVPSNSENFCRDYHTGFADNFYTPANVILI